MLSLRIALRYLFARKSHNAVNVIAMVAVAGVTVAVAAMVVVLSVFNGFSDLAARHLAATDPPLSVQRADGRAIDGADSLARVLAHTAGIRAAYPVVLRRALAVSPSGQMAVMLKGVPPQYGALRDPDSVMVAGAYAPLGPGGEPACQASVGVANRLLLVPGTDCTLQFYTPRRRGRINTANPMTAFNHRTAVVSGVFVIGQTDVDADLVLAPLDMVRALMDFDTQADAIEVIPAGNGDLTALQDALQRHLGPGYKVLDQLQQRGDAFRMISVEKYMTFMLLAFVLGMAMFNIVSVMSLLVIEKRANMATLRALGAKPRLVRGIFARMAVAVTALGGVAGLTLGLLLSLAQQHLHLIKLAGDPGQLTIEWYPVVVRGADMPVVAAAVAVAAALAALVTLVLTRRL